MPDLFKQESSLSKVRFIIGVAAGKGGVGKSTMAVNLALAGAQQGLKIGLLDADVYGPSLIKMLPKNEPSMESHESGYISPAISRGIKWISAGHFQEEDKSVTIRAPIANSVIQQLLYQVDWGDLDILFIDFPPGTGDIQITLAQTVNFSGIIIVTTPQELALLDVRKAIHQFLSFNVPIIGIIENMSYFEIPQTKQKQMIFGQGGAEKLSAEFGCPLLGQVPLHPAISHASDSNLSFFEDFTDIKELFTAFTKNILEFVSVDNENDSLKSFELKWNMATYPSIDSSKKTREGSLIEIASIFQEDEFHFVIIWTDSKKSRIRLSELQSLCPCARCHFKRENGGGKEELVSAIRLYNYGRYAIRVEFTSGCSKGVYSFNLLRQFNPC